MRRTKLYIHQARTTSRNEPKILTPRRVRLASVTLGRELFSAFLEENGQAQNNGRKIVFSADLCYNGANEKPPSEREGDRVSGGRSLRDFELELTLLSRTLPQSASQTAPSRMEPLDALAHL